jgi:hypothetical protein
VTAPDGSGAAPPWRSPHCSPRRSRSFRCLSLAALVLLYLVPVLLTAAVGGLWPAVGAAVAADLVVNWFFVPPYRTLAVDTRDNLVALASTCWSRRPPAWRSTWPRRGPGRPDGHTNWPRSTGCGQRCSARWGTTCGPELPERYSITTLGGRFSYGVDSTTVVRVVTLAAVRICCSNRSRSAGLATRTSNR